MAARRDEFKKLATWHEQRMSDLIDDLHFRNKNYQLLADEYGISVKQLRHVIYWVQLVKTIDYLRAGLPDQEARQKAEEYIYGPVPEPETHITFEYEPRRPGGAVC